MKGKVIGEIFLSCLEIEQDTYQVRQNSIEKRCERNEED